MSELKGVIERAGVPTVNDDIDSGFYVGFEYVDSNTKCVYISTSSTVGAAKWDLISTSVFTLSQYITIPLRGVVDNQILLLGENRSVTTGETGDFATDFVVDNQHVVILVNTITTGGDIVITGDSVNESTGVVTSGDTETITVDTTASQHYQTTKKWWVITNINISTGAIVSINYDVLVVGYSDVSNTNYKMTGYRLDAFAQGSDPDFNFIIMKVQDDGSSKMSFVELENIGVDSNNAGDQVIDSLRTGGSDRSYNSPVASLWNNNTNLTLKQSDFDTFFTSDENEFQSSTKDTGFYIEITGSPSGAITNVDYITIRIDYQLLSI